MASTVYVKRTDDLDGSEALQEPVKFGLDGIEWEIDLSEAHNDELREFLVPFINAGRKVTKKISNRKTPPSNPKNKEIREWAIANGLEVSDKGRLTKEIIDRYNESQESVSSDD